MAPTAVAKAKALEPCWPQAQKGSGSKESEALSTPTAASAADRSVSSPPAPLWVQASAAARPPSWDVKLGALASFAAASEPAKKKLKRKKTDEVADEICTKVLADMPGASLTDASSIVRSGMSLRSKICNDIGGFRPNPGANPIVPRSYVQNLKAQRSVAAEAIDALVVANIDEVARKDMLNAISSAIGYKKQCAALEKFLSTQPIDSYN